MLALPSHSHNVTGIVPAILSRTLTFGSKDVSHSLIDLTGFFFTDTSRTPRSGRHFVNKGTLPRYSASFTE